jgi:biopolymer transport protein ExbD
MKFRKRQRNRAGSPVDLAPMIDVVFQLLLFFMLSSTFVVQSSIQIEMPKAEGATELEQKDLSVTIAYGEGGPGGKGKVYIDNEEMPNMEALTKRLVDEVQKHPQLQLLVRTDTRTDTGRLVEVLGIANSVGIKRLGIGAQPTGGSP